MLEALVDERRAVRLRIGGEERWVAADDAGLYRDAFGTVPPGGLPAAFLASVERPTERLVARYARTHGPFTTADLRERWSVDPSSALAALESAGDLVRGELRPGGTEREWCDPEVLRRIRRASLAVLRKEIEATDQRALAAFLPSWQGVDRHAAAGAGIDRLREMLVPLQRLALPADVWERDVLRRRVGAYSPTWLDQLCASGEVVWVGAGALGRNSGRVALYFREDAEALGPPSVRGGDRPSRAARARPAARAAGRLALLLHRLPGRDPAGARADPGGAVGPRLGGRGDQRRLRAAARAAADAGTRAEGVDSAGVDRAPARASASRRGTGAAAAGPGPLGADDVDLPRRGRPRPAPPDGRRAAARALRHRHPRARPGRGHPRRVLVAV